MVLKCLCINIPNEVGLTKILKNQRNKTDTLEIISTNCGLVLRCSLGRTHPQPLNVFCRSGQELENTTLLGPEAEG